MRTLLLLLLSTVLMVSCKKDDDADLRERFQGNWNGSYTGPQDNGLWFATVSSEGVVTGTVTSMVFAQTLDLNGTVSSNGDFSASVGSISNMATFEGTMTENEASGTWSNNAVTPPTSGTWDGEKD